MQMCDFFNKIFLIKKFIENARLHIFILLTSVHLLMCSVDVRNKKLWTPMNEELEIEICC